MVEARRCSRDSKASGTAPCGALENVEFWCPEGKDADRSVGQSGRSRQGFAKTNTGHLRASAIISTPRRGIVSGERGRSWVPCIAAGRRQFAPSERLHNDALSALSKVLLAAAARGLKSEPSHVCIVCIPCSRRCSPSFGRA